MSTFTVISATDIDQDSPLTGLNETVPARDSLMEHLRENDAYIYERMFRSQQAQGGFYGSVTSDYIDPTAFEDPWTDTPPMSASNGFRLSQMDDAQRESSSSVLVTAPGGGPTTGSSYVALDVDVTDNQYFFAGGGIYYFSSTSGSSTIHVEYDLLVRIPTDGTNWQVEIETNVDDRNLTQDTIGTTSHFVLVEE